VKFPALTLLISELKVFDLLVVFRTSGWNVFYEVVEIRMQPIENARLLLSRFKEPPTTYSLPHPASLIETSRQPANMANSK
jgi:hypothetical protein